MEEVVAELQKERQKNAELLQRISVLEAQVMQHETETKSAAQLIMDDDCQDSRDNSIEERSNKRQKTGTSTKNLVSIMKSEDIVQSQKDSKHENGLVSWMGMGDTQLPLLFDKSEDAESIMKREDTDDSNDVGDESCTCEDADSCARVNNEDNKGTVGEKKDMMTQEKIRANQNVIEIRSMNQKLEREWEGVKKSKGYRNLSLQKKPPKVSFCPKEVRSMLESQVLSMTNAQSHTMRKIIVFASLGIRHGCDDMYELDCNHFSILRKGDPYVSQTDPGEHVLYENPGVRRKVFYPNRDNPALCPVKILEEERAMRPSDASCPSWLFLCIKYGGKTRNIPQNEYVRQRMGRNKLKSFGPLICLMARLVNIRTGSFFFKALGITLLFMAGFPDDIVQRETKYKNLDLLQKYYRTDEDASGEELFVANPSTSYPAIPDIEKPITKKKGSKGKEKTADPPSENSQMSTPQETIHPDASFQTKSSSNNMVIHSLQPHILYNQHPMCPMFFPPQPANAMAPLMYWPLVQNAAYPAFPHPSPFGYQSLEGIHGGNYMSVHPWRPCYSQGLGSRIAVNSNEAAVTDPASSSCSAEPK